MNNTKKVQISWLEGIKLDADSEGYQEVTWDSKYKNVAVSSVKRYYNCLYLLSKLSPCARNLMDYLTEEMDDSCLIRSSKHDRERFMKFISDITGGEITYGHQSVKNAYTELADKNLLIHKQKGLYKVNELYFFRESDGKRLKAIKLSIQIGSTADVFKFLEDRIINL